ncbi:MAG: beta-lactamase family protein [Pseudomonadota bacterium]|nr:beta-lactamase family protein [Pseudomonadota bacterium]
MLFIEADAEQAYCIDQEKAVRIKFQMAVGTFAVMGAQSLLAGAPVPMDRMDTLQHCLTVKAQHENFSGVISVSDHGQTASIFRGRLADPGSPPIGLRTRFNLASMGKMFTAVAVIQLVEAGKVRLDGPVGLYVKGLTPETSAVTVRQLLTHSAGLGNFFRPQNMEVMLKARTAGDLLPLIATDKPTFTPGSRFEYSNSGFALLGILIEKASGMTYADYLQRRVFDPAGMKDTGLDPRPFSTLAIGMTAGPGALFAPGPGGGGNGLVLIGPDRKTMSPGQAPTQGSAGTVSREPRGVMSPPTSAKPTLSPAPGATEAYGSSAGGVFSTADDLQRFANALTGNKLTSAAMTTALTNMEIVAAPASEGKPERDYGFGFGVGSKDGHRWYGHNGGSLGANTEFAVFPDDQLVLTVLSNRDPPMATHLFSYALELALHPAARATCGKRDGRAASAG